VILVLAYFYFWRKTNAGQMNNIFELRKSKSRPVADRDKARFTDIRGAWPGGRSVGGPRGFPAGTATVEGVRHAAAARYSAGRSAGNGQDVVGAAVAGETQSAFLYTSAAEFVEMFVGIGAARVRDTFEKAQRNSGGDLHRRIGRHRSSSRIRHRPHA